jgi:hypothetical protein
MVTILDLVVVCSGCSGSSRRADGGEFLGLFGMLLRSEDIMREARITAMLFGRGHMLGMFVLVLARISGNCGQGADHDISIIFERIAVAMARRKRCP